MTMSKHNQSERISSHSSSPVSTRFVSSVPWRQCILCEGETFKSPREFSNHLLIRHCKKEGGSYICMYGTNSICQTLPLEGVSERDYESHVNRVHISPSMGARSASLQKSTQSLSGPANTTKPPSETQYKQTAAPQQQPQQQPVYVVAKPIKELTSILSKSSSSPVLTSIGSTEKSSSASAFPNKENVQMDGDKPLKDKTSSKAVIPRTEKIKPKEKWTLFHSKINLASLLNDPRPGKRQPDFFSKTWGVGWDYLDLTLPAELYDISEREFQSYRKHIVPRITHHIKGATGSSDVTLPIDAFPALYTRAHDKADAELDKIPTVFHSQTFDLSDISLFNQIFPWSDIQSNQSKSKRLLQEQLSHYLDKVEVQIARQVALKSDAFFSVLTSHDDLQARLKASLQSISVLRNKCAAMDGALVKHPLQMMVMVNRKQRLQSVVRKLKLMSTLHQTQPTVQQLLANNDFIGALDIISTAQQVLRKELTGIHSFRYVSSQLAELQKAIDDMAQQEFLSFITKYLNQPFDETNEFLDKGQFTAIYMGLLRLNSNNFLDVLKSESFATIKAIVKQIVVQYVSAVDRVGSDESNTLADQMRMLNYSSWLLLMDDVFSNLLNVLNRIKVLTGLMECLNKEAVGLALAEDESSTVSDLAALDQPFISEQYYESLTKDVKDVVVKSCDQCCDRCAKVVHARSKDMSLDKLSPQEFFKLTSSVERFIRACEQFSACRLSNNPLRSYLQSYSIRFINKFHEERRNRLNLLLDHERWRTAEVPRDLQALISHCELSEQLTMSEFEPPDLGSTLSCISVNNEKYATIGTVLSLVKMIIEYCTYLEDFPKSASDILNKLLEILRIFNSRSSQLLLGAGVLQQVGLKRITTKNLALLVRSLELILFYLPQIRKQFSVYLGDNKSSMLRHIETVISDYTQHVTIVRNKLKELTAEMVGACVSQWELRAPMPSACFRQLCKQINKLYEDINGVLEQKQLEGLFVEMYRLLKTRLRDRLKALNITHLTGPQQGLIMSDLAYFSKNTPAINEKLELTLQDIVPNR